MRLLLALIVGTFVLTAPAKVWAQHDAAELSGMGVAYSPGHTDIILVVNPTTEIIDYSLEKPERIVIDLLGVAIADDLPRYDRVLRGGVFDVQVHQVDRSLTRVTLDVAHPYRYTIYRERHILRIRLITGLERFDPWFSSATARAVANLQSSRVIDARAKRDSSGSAEGYRTEGSGATDRENGLSQHAGGDFSPGQALSPSAARRITVNYHQADILDVISAFAAFSGRTIVAGKDVKGVVSAEIKDQPWDDALRALLRGQGYSIAADPTSQILTVDSYANLHARQSLEPLVTEIVHVNYAKADSLADVIRRLLIKDCFGQTESSTNNLASNCTTRGVVVSNPSTNTIIITEAPSRMGQILEYVKSLDVRIAQVAIKARILFVNRTEIENLGVSYDIGTPQHYLNQLAPRPLPPGGAVAPGGDRILLGGNSLAAIANASSRVPNAALSLIYSAAVGKYSITGFLDALQEVRLADLQAEPSIVTVDNREATIQVGQDVPVRVLDANTTTIGDASGIGGPRATVSFRPVGIILKVTPHITNNRQVLLDVHAENSDAQIASSDVGYVFNKQSAMNRLLVRDGETAVIGGLTVTQVSESFTGVPVLSKLPLLGRLFRTSAKQKEKRDLLILITPYIVDDGDRAPALAELK